MTRQLKDWLPAYLDYTAGTEAPSIMHFWCGVSCIAACLRRKVWVDMRFFEWYPSFYIIFVAPPGVVSKTTTMDTGMNLLKQVEGIKFGPDSVTWQSLVEKFAEAQEEFLYQDAWMPMSAITLASGELGCLLDPQDRHMINTYITLWDSRKTFEKSTKTSGEDMVSAPWINMIGCTTPKWIADTMPKMTVGGGFTSRCVFIYADKKERFVAYPDECAPPNHEELERKLVADLNHIATALVGPFTITQEARKWGREWYEQLWAALPEGTPDDQREGYRARKQTHVHKLAMVLSVSRGDDMTITLEDLVLADKMLEASEKDHDKVFSLIGRSDQSLHAERFIEMIRRAKRIPYTKAYQLVHSYFPDLRDFKGMLEGAINSGQVKLVFEGNSTLAQDAVLIYTGG